MNINFNPPKQEVHADANQAQIKGSRFLGTLMLHNGHKMYEYNTKTHEIKEAEYAKVDATFPTVGATSGVKRKLVFKEECIYASALNEKNAMRKLSKRIREQINAIK